MKGIPFAIAGFLHAAIARAKRICLVRGIATAGIVWVLGIAAAMSVDSQFVIFDDRIRWAMSVGVWLMTFAAAMLAIVWPLRRRLDFRRMAEILDRRHPEQEERLSTLVELSERDAEKAGFSLSLFALVVDLAESDVGKLDLRREFPMSGAWRRFGIFVLMALSLGIGALVSPNLVGRLFVRAVAPWSDVGNLFSDEIAVRPGDITVLSGTVIRIEASATEACSIRISRKTPGGWSAETSEEMSGGIYETTADLNERVWRYRVTAGHAVTRYFHVRVSQMPRYDLFTATVNYPDYTRQQPLVLSNSDVMAITAIQGSRVKFDVKVSDPGTLVDFRIGKEPLFEHTMVSNKTVAWSLDLVNEDGFRAEKGRHQLTSFVDKPPTVIIEKPTGTLRLPPHAKIPVEITATDDIGISGARMRVSIDGEPWDEHQGIAIDLPADRRFVRTVADVDLSLYDLIFAKSICFDVVVSDACPPEFGGPHSATSMPFTVRFAADEASYEVQELKQEVADARRDIEEARKRLNDAQHLGQQVRDALRRDQRATAATEGQSERLAHELDEAEKRIAELRDRFLSDERFAPLARPLERILEETVNPLLENVENAQFKSLDERADAVSDAMPEMEKAARELNDFSNRLAERADKVDAFEKARDLAARQEALAKAAEELVRERPLDTAKLEAWTRLEAAAMRKADELARQDPDSDFSEAKRKMETAAREMAKLKAELEAAAAEADRLKKETAGELKQFQRQQGEMAAELARAIADQERALAALAHTNLTAAAGLQQTVQRRQELAKSLPAVKALQDLAHEATELARQSKTPDKQTLEQSRDLQQAAAEAAKAEQALREALANPTNKVGRQALEKLDRELRNELPKRQAALEAAKEAQRLAAETQAAEDKKDQQPDQVKQQADILKPTEQKALAAAAADQKKASEELAKGKFPTTAAAQRSAEQNLRQGRATEGTKALQKAASKAAEAAAQSPRQADAKNGQPSPTQQNAQDAQKAAAEALTKEREIREAMEKGKASSADLDALDRANRKAAADAAKKLEVAKAADKAADLVAAAESQQAAQKALDAVAANRNESAQQRRNGDSPLDQQKQSELAGKAKEAAEQAASAVEAQKQADALLQRGEATGGTKALQKLADKAAAASQKAPHDVGRAQRAASAQKAASKALDEEMALRKAIESGEKTAADLDAFDRATQAKADRQTAAFNRDEKSAAERDDAASRQRIGEEQDLSQAVADQKRAANAIQQAAAKRAEEARARAAGNRDFAGIRAREAQNLERQAAEAQRAAEDRLERSGATEGVKALQQLATTAARNARKAPQTKEKSDLAAAAQKAATEALQNELKVREGMRKGEMTEEDLAALDDQLKAGLLKTAGERTEAATAAARAAIKKAKDVIGTDEDDQLEQLAADALEAVRDALSYGLSENRLKESPKTDSLREAEDEIDAIMADTAEEQSVEDRIQGLQQSAAEALARNDRARAMNLQKEIARAQTRAADNVDEEEETAARAAANEAQDAAAEAVAKAYGNWNNENKAAAAAAQKEAIEREQAARDEARAVRSLAKLSAAEKAVSRLSEQSTDSDSAQSSEQASSSKSSSKSSNPSKAAETASDAMDREVNAQAAALGMSNRKSGAEAKGKNTGKGGAKGGGGGGVGEEVKKLANDLKRKDQSDFLKSLFSRLGWFKIRGLSRDGLDAGDMKDIPIEYRDLVRRYFLKIAEENR